MSDEHLWEQPVPPLPAPPASPFSPTAFPAADAAPPPPPPPPPSTTGPTAPLWGDWRRPGDEPPPPSAAPRRGGKVLLVLALLGAGGVGGAVAAGLDRGPAPVPADGYVSRTTAAVSTVSAAPSAGTPESAAAAIGPSVVTVEVTGTQATGFFGDQQQISDTGSGVVLRPDGYILTNNHVIAAALANGSVHVTFSDGRTAAASIVGHDTTSDLAVIKASGVSGLRVATFADSERLRVGQAVLAVGAPLGLSNTVTEGIVSTLHRPVRTGEAGASAQSVIDAVQTDAAINPGNSGGALVDLGGRVVGINSAIASTGGGAGGQAGNIGVGFAIPSDDAARIADELIATGHATHAQMGVNVGDAFSTTRGAPGPGATLQAVAAGGPAEKAGLQAGDVVTKVGGRRVTDADSLIVAVRSFRPGTAVPVVFSRNGNVRTVTVTLAGVTAS